MRNIVIVEAVSTGYNFVGDVIKRGYNPVLLEVKDDTGEDTAELRRTSYEMLETKPEIIREDESYEKTLARIKELDPVVVVAGSESGVPLATRLADDLGLPGNPAENIPQMTRKDMMHEALKKAGIRYIKGRKIKSVEEALEFCKENKFTDAVVKPLQSAASQGLFLCNNLSDVENAVNTLLKMQDIFGRPITEVIIQERIRGTEYIVNTVSCNGVHKMNSMLRYKKQITPEGGYIYDYIETISRLESGHSEMVQYALKVADAIGIKYGMVHGEYVIDKTGPVLIEVNCRPMGCSMTAEFLDSIYGQHETDTTLDCYLDPDKFMANLNKPYRPKRKGVLKLIIVPGDREVEDHPVWQIGSQLRSIYRIAAGDGTTARLYHKTRDLESNGGILYLVHDDEHVVQEDLKLLKEIEHRYFQYILNEGMSRRWFPDPNVPKNDFEGIIKNNRCQGGILVLADDKQDISGAKCVTPAELPGLAKGYDYVIVGCQDCLTNMSETECLKIIFNAFSLLRPGGKVIIPKGTWHYLSYGRQGAELLLRVTGLVIEPPSSADTDEVIGTNEDIIFSS
ncbi:MAG: ATP-grasp domain-containing protein [Saccharofermentans sp.]|nr:ATP-grasp domain-containing protein [Saccharofermentans sp.]